MQNRLAFAFGGDCLLALVPGGCAPVARSHVLLLEDVKVSPVEVGLCFSRSVSPLHKVSLSSFITSWETCRSFPSTRR